MTLSTAMTDALSAPAVRLFVAVKVELPGAVTLRLLDGPGFLTIGGETYTGRDATYGALAALEALDDGVDAEAPSLRLTIDPPSKEAAATLADPGVQGAAVTVWEGVFDPVTGAAVADPDMIFLGEVDTPTLQFPNRQRRVVYDVASAWERFFEDDEGARLSDAFHQSIYPGEKGMQFVTGVEKQVYWGSNAPRDAVTPGKFTYLAKKLGFPT